MTDSPAPNHAPGDDPQQLAREFLASALYMALVLLAALVGLPVRQLPSDAVVVATLVGTAVGLILAHWLAFRLASHLTVAGGVWEGAAVREAGAQVLGGLAVALVASLPFVFLDGADALDVALLLLALMPAATGLVIARLRGHSWLRSIVLSAVVLAVAVAVVEFKAAVGH
jgi:hypothetical protein